MGPKYPPKILLEAFALELLKTLTTELHEALKALAVDDSTLLKRNELRALLRLVEATELAELTELALELLR